MPKESSDPDVLQELRKGFTAKTASEIAERSSSNPDTIESRLNELVGQGDVERIECGDERWYRVARGRRSQTASDVLHTTLDMEFRDAVDNVQIEHEIGGFETVAVTRLDQMVMEILGEDVDRAALIVVCHAEIAHSTLEIDPGLAGMLPCTTVVYEVNDVVHVKHVSVTKALRELGFAPEGTEEEIDDLVELTGDRVSKVWRNVEEMG